MFRRFAKTRFEEDAALVARFQSGDKSAFDELDRRYRARLTRFLAKRSSFDLAEELAQETLTRAFGALDALEVGTFFAGWLYRIAFRALTDVERRRKSPVERAVSYLENDDSNENRGEGSRDAFSLSAVDPRRPDGTRVGAEPPDARLRRRETRENVWKLARAELTPNEFRALWLVYVGECSDREAARALGKSPGAIRALLSRARKKLAVKLRSQNYF